MTVAHFLLILGVVLTLSDCNPSRQDLGEELVSKIEAYREKHQKLPEELGDLGIVEKLEGPVYYQKESNTDYLIWYGMDLGSSMTYDSKTKKWEPTG